MTHRIFIISGTQNTLSGYDRSLRENKEQFAINRISVDSTRNIKIVTKSIEPRVEMRKSFSCLISSNLLTYSNQERWTGFLLKIPDVIAA